MTQHAKTDDGVLCPPVQGTRGSGLFLWTTGVLCGQEGHWSQPTGSLAATPQGKGQGTFPFSALHCNETGHKSEAWSVTCIFGTTRCLESSVLLSMRLLQSSRSTVLWEKLHQLRGTRMLGGPVPKPAHTLKEFRKPNPHKTHLGVEF